MLFCFFFLYFLVLASCLLILFVVLLLHESNFYVVVVLSCCFGLFAFYFLLDLFCFLFRFCFVIFEGFKGQVRWPQKPPHLGLNPLLDLVWFVLFFWFGFFVSF